MISCLPSGYFASGSTSFGLSFFFSACGSLASSSSSRLSNIFSIIILHLGALLDELSNRKHLGVCARSLHAWSRGHLGMMRPSRRRGTRYRSFARERRVSRQQVRGYLPDVFLAIKYHCDASLCFRDEAEKPAVRRSAEVGLCAFPFAGC